MITDYMTVAEAAERLGYTPGAIRNVILSGRLPYIRAGRRTILIRRSDVEAFVRHAPGWPKKVSKKVTPTL